MLNRNTNSFQDNETSRIEAFSDGVFAIEMTLLSFQLRGPAFKESFTSRTLFMAMLQQWPAYVAFLLSFATIFVIWVNHHRMFNVIRRSDSQFMYQNGLLLLLTAAIPFSASILATYIDTSAAELATALSMLIFGVITGTYYWMWQHATTDFSLLKRPAADVRIQTVKSGLVVITSGYGLAVLVALLLPIVSILIGLMMVVLLARLKYHRERVV
ncbi:MAG: DUF1211 domain-containing protein [Bacteroidetes bacterium]|nr:DUF1211 domain-containing protein [Fibrella sp.]